MPNIRCGICASVRSSNLNHFGGKPLRNPHPSRRAMVDCFRVAQRNYVAGAFHP